MLLSATVSLVSSIDQSDEAIDRVRRLPGSARANPHHQDFTLFISCVSADSWDVSKPGLLATFGSREYSMVYNRGGFDWNHRIRNIYP
jgi:hypothetical protein